MSKFTTQHEDFKNLQRRLLYLRTGLLLCLLLLSARLWYLQVVKGTYYHELAEQNRVRTVDLKPARGLIFDRRGELLANNVPSFNLYLTVEDIRDREGLAAALEGLIGLPRAETMKRLVQQAKSYVPILLKSGLTLREDALLEGRRLEFTGLRVQAESQRSYVHGPLGSHLLGYVGEVSPEQQEEPAFEGLVQGSIVGKAGVEKTYDRMLRGKPGEKTIEVDARGNELKTVAVVEQTPGDDLYLSLDLRLQRFAESLLGVESGAIVALDPRNGDVLAMASSPAYDPNVLSRGLTPALWEQIASDTRHPLTNRALQGQYPPGSTFKIMVASAALESDKWSADTKVRCTGTFPSGNRLFKDWKRGGHGVMDLSQAIVQSCDVYFYNVGYRLGIDTIAETARLFGLGQPTGIDLPSERVGVVPSTEWKQRMRKEPWYPGETISASIGQGYITVTPLQMAVAIAAVSNGGTLHRPRLVRAVRERATGRLQEFPSVERGPVPLQESTFHLLQDALQEVVLHGTGGRARSQLVSIAGKTGTAQTVGGRTSQISANEEAIPKQFRDHAWFVAYAPAEDPKIAVAVIVENTGHGGTYAAPIAKALIEEYWKDSDVDDRHQIAGQF
ncbi:MAG TPA: penicillin-binding protein 2 [Nitrospirales bacterium]|nr:penicillin-binding protein 2 [Nitrospirales bacterium]